MNSENIILCNWNEISKKIIPKQVFHEFSESQTNPWYVVFGKLIPEKYFLVTEM